MSSAVVVVGALRVKDKGVFFVMAFEDHSDICSGRILILRQKKKSEQTLLAQVCSDFVISILKYFYSVCRETFQGLQHKIELCRFLSLSLDLKLDLLTHIIRITCYEDGPKRTGHDIFS